MPTKILTSADAFRMSGSDLAAIGPKSKSYAAAQAEIARRAAKRGSLTVRPEAGRKRTTAKAAQVTAAPAKPARKPADPQKKAAAEAASLLHPRGTSAWWQAYRAVRAEQALKAVA